MSEEEKVIRQLPHDIEAEKAVITAMISSQEYAHKIRGILGSENLEEGIFYDERHNYIARIVNTLLEEKRPIDPLIVKSKLRDLGYSHIVKEEYIDQLVEENLVIDENLTAYLEIVLEKYHLRTLIKLSKELSERAYLGIDTEEIVEKIEKQFFKIRNKTGTQEYFNLKEIFLEFFKNLIEKQKDYIPTGYPSLDDLTGGFKPGQLIILAGATGMGKTAFSLSLIYRVALELLKDDELKNKQIVYFTLEMTKEEVAQRLLSIASRISLYRIRNKKITPEEVDKLMAILDELTNLPIIIDDRSGIRVMDIESKIKWIQYESRNQGKELGLVVVDYLQLIESDDKRLSREQQVGSVAARLKYMAKDLGIPIIALSQLNRNVEKREDRKPKLSDLRESGAIEQFADLVLFVYRPYYYTQDLEEENEAKLIIAKHRSGRNNVEIDLKWIPEYTYFVEKVSENVEEEYANYLTMYEKSQQSQNESLNLEREEFNINTENDEESIGDVFYDL